MGVRLFFLAKQGWQFLKFHHHLFLGLNLFAFVLGGLFPAAGHAQVPLHVRVGAYDNPPKISIAENGKVSGFWFDLLAHIGAIENWNIEYVPSSWNAAMENLRNGELDIMVDIALSPERSELYTFSEEPVLTTWSRVYVKNDNSEIQTILDLNDKKIGGLRGSINIEGHDGLKELVRSFHFSTIIVEFDTYTEVFEAVKNGLVDGGLSNRDFGDFKAPQYLLKRTPIIIQPINMMFAFPKEGKLTPLLRAAIDRHMKSLRDDGNSVYYQLLNRYFEGGVQEKEIEILPFWFRNSLIIGLSVIVIFLSALIISRLQIRGKTKELLDQNIKLHKREEQYRLLTDNTLDVIWAMNMNLEFTYVNPAITELTGYSPEEWVGFHLAEHFNADSLAEITKVIADEIAKGPASTGTTIEAEVYKKNGKLVPVEIRGRIVFDKNGQPGGLQGTARDISERRRAESNSKSLERQLIQAQKMEAVGRLAGGVAHDFNNMLTLIIGYSELALDQLKPDAQFKEEFDLIYNAAKKSAGIVQQLLAFSRQQTINPKVQNLNEALQNMLKMLQRLIGENIDLTWLPGHDLWPVKIDVSQIDQILANFCVNSRDAIDDVGKITIETKNITLDQDYCADHLGFVPGDYVMLAFSDDGCGMDKETRDKVFEPFFTTKETGHGTGLGLATVYGIVKQNNGFINVYSESGVGTTFHIYLPRYCGGADAVRATEREEPLRGDAETVLVVEDEAQILKLTRRVLEGYGYIVVTAATASDAIDMVKKSSDRIDLLITDVIMPQMNGRELSERLQAMQPGLKCLFMSGYPATVIAHHGILEKGVNFIQKPVSRKELAAKVREALGKNSRIS